MYPLHTARPSWFPFGFSLTLAVLFAAVTFTAWAALLTDAGGNGEAAVWWSNAILLAALLLNKRERWPAIFIAGYLANVLSHLIAGDSLVIGLGLSACDLLEIAIAAYPFARITRDAIRFSRPRQLARLCLVGALIAPAVSAVCASAVYRLHGPLPPKFGSHWFLANALGIIAITPIILSFFDGEIAALFQRKKVLETIGLLLLMFICTDVVFRHTSFPLLFVLFPPLLLVVVRLGMGGGMLGVSIIAVFSVVFTAHGRGPMTLIHDVSWERQLFFIQVLLASAVLCVSLVAVVLNERRLLEQAARKSEQLYRLLAENSRDIIVLTDLNHRREYVSPAVKSMLGWEPQELMGATYRQSVVHPDDIAAVTAMLEALKNGEPAKTLTYRCQKKDGSYLWMEANISLYCDRVSGNPIGYVNVVRNVAERKAAEEKLQDAYLALEALASVDALTGVANRRQFDEVLAREWRRAMRTESPVSLLLLDVDHFKLYNDLYGHLRGDSCLRQIAEAGLDVIQRSGDTVARFGGEEFAVILPETDRYAALDLAERIRQKVEERCLEHRGNSPGIITVSIGCATLIPQRGSDANTLIEAADQALYEAKRAGRNRVVVDETDPYRQMLRAE
jgi:diguanylate cyclase (GGDEF)-like protein/PAS domain S-box-containing protein